MRGVNVSLHALVAVSLFRYVKPRQLSGARLTRYNEKDGDLPAGMKSGTIQAAEDFLEPLCAEGILTMQ